MAVRLMILGGGESADFAGPFQKIKSLAGIKPLSVLLLPQAVPPKHYPDYAKWLQDCFEENSLKAEITTWSDLQKRSLSELERFDAVFLGGGNTFLLVQKLRESGFDRLLKDSLLEGKFFLGNSAGAILLGKDFRYAHDRNLVGVRDFSGLAQLGAYAVWCHYNPPQFDEEIEEYIRITKNPVIALPNEGGIYLEDGKLNNVGNVPVTFFDKRGSKEILPPGGVKTLL